MVEAHPCEAKRELGTGVTTDVAVIDVGVVAFKVAFKFTGEGETRILRDPFRLGANAEGAGLDMDLRVGGGTCIREEEREGPVLAAEGGPATGGGVGGGGGFVEAVELQIGATAQSDIGNHPALFGDVDRSEEHTS